MQYIYGAQEILKDLNEHIKNGEPWSLVRLGDAGIGIISAMRAPGIVDRGKWKVNRHNGGGKGKRLANSILGQLTIPTPEREILIDRVIDSMNKSNYMDHYDCFNELTCKKGVGVLGEKQDEIYKAAGIDNGYMFCNPFVHYFSIVAGEYNLVKLMRNRRIFCITSRQGVITKLKKQSGAKVIHSYRIPRRGRRAKHYKDHYNKVCNIIRHRSQKYDLFLIGAGLLAVNYCGLVKKNGGRAFDAGRLFDFWSGMRKVDSRGKRFIKYNPSKMLCDRIRKSKVSEVW